MGDKKTKEKIKKLELELENANSPRDTQIQHEIRELKKKLKKENKTTLGSVRWFNDASGEGVIRDLETPQCFTIHWSAITGSQMPSNTKNYDVKNKKWVTLTQGALVRYELLDDYDYSMISKVQEIPDPDKLVLSQSLINFSEGIESLEERANKTPTPMNLAALNWGIRNFDSLIEEVLK